MLRGAVLGCGAIGAGEGGPPHPEVGVGTHVEAYMSCAEAELVAVADADAERARVVAGRAPGVAAFEDVAALLAEARPELVSVATPDATHAEVLEAVLSAPGVRGVLAEKPLAATAAQARALAELARERGVVLAVNYSRRFAPALVALAEDVRGGALGAVQHVHGVYGKGLRHNGTHWLDLLRMLTGTEPEVVRAHDRLGEGGDDPSLDAELRLPDGATAVLAALDHTAYTDFALELHGTAGAVRLSDGARRIERFAVAPDPRHAGHRILVPDGPPADGVLRDAALHAVADLVAALRDGRAPACTAQDGVRALQLAEACAPQPLAR